MDSSAEGAGDRIIKVELTAHVVATAKCALTRWRGIILERH